MKARISYDFFKERSFYTRNGVEFSLNGIEKVANEIIWDVMKHQHTDYYACQDILIKNNPGKLAYMPIHSSFVYLIEDAPKYTEFLNKLEELY